MFNILSLLSKLLNVFYIIAAVVIVYFIYSTATKFFGPDQDAKVRGQLEVVVGTVEASNKELVKTIEIQKKASDISQVTVVDVLKDQQDNISSKGKDRQKVEEKVVDIKKKHDDLISQTKDQLVSAKLIKEKETEVSQVRITALWSNFCKYEKQEPECKDIVL